MSRCQNKHCEADYCTRWIKYGDIDLCYVCYKRTPHKLRSEAVRTGKNQGLEHFKSTEER